MKKLFAYALISATLFTAGAIADTYGPPYIPSNVNITGGTISGVTITNSTVTASGTATITGGTINNTTVGVTTPAAARFTTLNNIVFTQPASTATATFAAGKTLTQNNTLTYNGTDGSTIAFGTGGTVLYDQVTGSFTPTIFGASTAGTTTYTTQQGKYVIIGSHLVCVDIYILYTGATGTGNMKVGNLPFTAASGMTTYPLSVYQTNLAVGAALQFGASVTTASNTADLYGYNPIGGSSTVPVDATGAEIGLGGCYFY